MLDYDKILDDWSEEMYKKIDKIQDMIDNCEDSGRTRFLEGYIKGVLETKAYLSLLENRKKDKYLIK